jgi:5-methylcytosine-specific restriction protein B
MIWFSSQQRNGNSERGIMDKNFQQLQEIWDAFLKEWPLERLRRMTLQEYTAVGQGNTFTAWIERRLDKMGSIWGGSAFKFGIFSRKDKTPKSGGGGDSYSQDYGWYTKYGSTPESAFAKVKSLVAQVAEAASRGDYAAINAVDLGEAFKWKIAYHYQDRKNPGVVAVFKPKRLQAWLKGRIKSIPSQTSELYRLILSLQGDKDLMLLSTEVWEQTATEEVPLPSNEEEERLDVDTLQDLPRNLILYGPPGTGKTYLTAELAVEICDGVVPDSREALMARYRELRNLRRIRFVTFHPSFSYEEFVEGIRPSTENGQVRYDVRPGIFKQVATHSRELFEKREAPAVTLDLKGRKLFKMSLGDKALSEETWIYPDCIENHYVCLGFARGVDFAGCDTLQAVRDRYRARKPDGEESEYGMTAINYLKNEIRERDLILISYGNTRFRAIAEVTGPYHFQAREAGYEHRRSVRWLWWTAAESLPVDMVSSKRLSQMSIYRMDQGTVNWQALEELLSPKRTGGQAPNCVLLIDEINRANLAKTFGELITLLEPSKRLGQPDEQETELPYSGDRLGVPPNLYVIGTMNTADRSIALMDTALRRRFAFREMTPRMELLEQDVEGINVQALLEAMNTRIESLFDRDHVLGHTYLMAITSFEELVQRFEGQIIPLLQEYFFDDWRRIQEVFNDLEQPPERQIIQNLDLIEDGAVVRNRRQRFRVNPIISPAAIQKIYT